MLTATTSPPPIPAHIPVLLRATRTTTTTTTPTIPPTLAPALAQQPPSQVCAEMLKAKSVKHSTAFGTNLSNYVRQSTFGTTREKCHDYF